MAKKQRLRVLSIDFDYFQVVDKDTVQSCYPDGIDLDTNLSTVVWASHYAIPSQKEKLDKVFCNQEELRLIRHILNNNCKATAPVCIANSHVHIYDFIKKNMESFGATSVDVTNVDMHHDLFNDNPYLDCGNWLGLCLKCKPISKNDPYKTEALSHDISYCEIKRMMFNNGWHYYVVLYLKGDAPKKLVKIGPNEMGIDPGVSTMAGVSDDKAVLKELAPKSKDYDKQIRKLQQKMDTSKRISNPNKYNQDGTINKSNRDRWVYSNTYRKNRRQLKCVYRKKSAYTKQSHEELANELLEDSSTFFVEDMNYAALGKKSKKPAERQDKTTDVKQKDGTIRAVKKYKKKKRYGKSLNNRSPSLFLSILKRKCELYGGQVQTVKTKTFKASQYDHVKDEYIKVPLSQREKVIGGYTVQRDLYSAFLIKNTDCTLEHADRDKCIHEFEHFVMIHDQLINCLKASNTTMKQCFGF